MLNKRIAIVGFILGLLAPVMYAASPAQAAEAHKANGAFIYHSSVGNDQAIGVWCFYTNVVRWLQKGQSAISKCPYGFGAYAFTMPQAYGVRCSYGDGQGAVYQYVPGDPDTIPWWQSGTGPNHCWSFAR
jgi:hypothetical protein